MAYATNGLLRERQAYETRDLCITSVSCDPLATYPTFEPSVKDAMKNLS